jgi:hypothetical protein
MEGFGMHVVEETSERDLFGKIQGTDRNILIFGQLFPRNDGYC